MLKQLFFMSLLVVNVVTTTSYASTKIYRQSEIDRVQNVVYGIIRHVRPVSIEQDYDNSRNYFGSLDSVGSLGGALAGGIAGNLIGKGRGRTLATAVGAIAGSIAGQKVQKHLATIEGQELEIQKDDGNTIIILKVHACASLPLFAGQNLIGALTLDSLVPDQFDTFSME